MTGNAKKTTITYGGSAIGGLVSWNLLEGRPREATWRPLDGSEPVSRPLPPEYGTCSLRLYYDPADTGQAALISSLRNRTTATVVVTHPNGATDTFTALCERFPVAGSIDSSEPVQITRVSLRVSGYVAHVDPA